MCWVFCSKRGQAKNRVRLMQRTAILLRSRGWGGAGASHQVWGAGEVLSLCVVLCVVLQCSEWRMRIPRYSTSMRNSVRVQLYCTS